MLSCIITLHPSCTFNFGPQYSASGRVKGVRIEIIKDEGKIGEKDPQFLEWHDNGEHTAMSFDPKVFAGKPLVITDGDQKEVTTVVLRIALFFLANLKKFNYSLLGVIIPPDVAEMGHERIGGDNVMVIANRRKNIFPGDLLRGSLDF